MFKWLHAPSVRARDNELADYAELISWQRNSMSVTALSRVLSRPEDNDYVHGVPEEDEVDHVVEESYVEIEKRREACGDGYPYTVDAEGYQLYNQPESDNHKYLIYRFLLLATRLNMASNRIHAEIDGSLLFEKLAAEAARRYLGDRARSHVFGTSAGGGSFVDRIGELCALIKEGDGFKSRNALSPRLQDDRLDIVAWTPFADQSQGKLIAFGQCKTGTSYRDALASLQPDAFCDKWFRSSPAAPPMRMFFVSEALSRSHWYSTARDAGILFDRCRIVDCCDEVRQDVLKDVATWTQAAAAANDLPP